MRPGPRIAIFHPQAAPEYTPALAWIAGAAYPPEGFVSGQIHVDGAEVPTSVSLAPDQVVIRGWCDTRGLPPGLHEIAVTMVWEDRLPVSETIDVHVRADERADPAAPVDSPSAAVGIVHTDSPLLERELAQAVLDERPVVLLAPEATLAEGALGRIAAAFAEHGVDVVIGDEAAMTGPDTWQRWRKRAFAPEALPAIDQVGPLLALGPRAADVLCDAIPSTPTPYACALELLDHQLDTLAVHEVLALTATPRLPTDDEQQRAAVAALAARRGRDVRIEAGEVEDVRDVRWPLEREPRVTAVIPTRTPALLSSCLAGLAQQQTDYAALDVVVVDSSGDTDAIAAVLDGAARDVRHVRYPDGEPFNFQRAMNIGLAEVSGDAVLLLNDDVVPLDPSWLTRLAELCSLPGVAIAGAKLLYPNGRIQHAGVDLGKITGHLYHDAPGDARGHRFELVVPGNPAAVTGACMLVRREVLAAVAGFDERYVHVYGDVDLCYRVTEHGWRVAWCPAARLTHAESTTYGDNHHAPDLVLLRERWGTDGAVNRSSRVRS